MRGLYLTSVTLHVLAALYWLGGMWFLALVAAPVLRRDLEPEQRALVLQKVGHRFRFHGWLALAVLLVTGVANLQLRGWLRPEVIGEASFWASPLGHALAGKLGLVLVMFCLAGIHDFLLGPLASPGTPAERRQQIRRAAVWVARLNAVAGLVLVYFAVRLARGG
ncbi:MAG: DUF4149 domain-containing protein [Thermoanaerobaculia bacterium]